MTRRDAEVRHFFTKVVGVTHRNDDGGSRQRIIQDCRARERLILEHDADNPVDPNAVRVCRENGDQLGFLRAELAEEVLSKSGRGFRYVAFVSEITGGRPDAPTLGVNLLIVVAPPGATDQEAREYIDSQMRPARRRRPASRAGCLGFVAVAVLILVGWTLCRFLTMAIRGIAASSG